MLGGELDPSVWGRLPHDLHWLFIEHLPLRSIARLRAVSKAWNRAWYYLVITNENSRIEKEEWEDAAWFQILSKFPEHRSQVRLSVVCQNWNRHRLKLPALKIDVPSVGKRKALKFIQSALSSRQGLRKVHIRYHGSTKTQCSGTGIPEHQILALLQPHRLQLEEITLYLLCTRFTRLWRHVAGRFPKLVSLKCGMGWYISPPADKTLANLTHLEFISFHLEATALERICRLCPSLERLSMICSTIPEMLGDEIITLESQSLRELLLGPREFSPAGLVLKMPRLRELYLYNCMLLELQGSESLRRIQVPLHPGAMHIEHLDTLTSLSLQKYQSTSLQSLQKILEAGTSLKKLRLWAEFDNKLPVKLSQIVPPQVELFYFESNLISVLDSDGEHWDQAGEAVVLLEGRGEDMFSLKEVAFNLRGLEHSMVVEMRLISILAQMLRCSPSLEYIALHYDWKFGDRQWLDGALLSFRAADARLILSWSGPGIDFFDPRCLTLHANMVVGW